MKRTRVAGWMVAGWLMLGITALALAQNGPGACPNRCGQGGPPATSHG